MLLLSFAAYAADAILDHPSAALPAVTPFFVWPLSGTADPDWTMSAYTPRWKQSASRYDFHPALDLLPRVTRDGVETYVTQEEILASPPEVHAVADGVVSALYPVGSSNFPNSGNVVRLRHTLSGTSTRDSNVYYTYYMHLADLCPTPTQCLSVGQTVRAGDVIAHLGDTASLTEDLDTAHLHLEVRGHPWQFYAVNPLRYLPHEETDSYTPEIVLADVLAGTCQAPFDPVDPVFAVRYTADRDAIDVNQVIVTVTDPAGALLDEVTVDYERRAELGEYADLDGDLIIKSGEYDPDALPGHAEPVFDTCGDDTPDNVLRSSASTLTVEILFTGLAGSPDGVRIEAEVCDVAGACEAATAVEAW